MRKISSIEIWNLITSYWIYLMSQKVVDPFTQLKLLILDSLLNIKLAYFQVRRMLIKKWVLYCIWHLNRLKAKDMERGLIFGRVGLLCILWWLVNIHFTLVETLQSLTLTVSPIKILNKLRPCLNSPTRYFRDYALVVLQTDILFIKLLSILG